MSRSSCARLAAVACLLPLALPVAMAQTAPPQIPGILRDYIYGYAPVVMSATRDLMTAVPDASSSPGRAPVNQFARVLGLATPDQTLIPRPNADTLYTLAWLDLLKEPMIVHVPDTQGRYYLLPLYDAYSNEFDSIGSRTTGTGAGDFAIVGPLWNGPLPQGVPVIRAPTNTVWILGRTLVLGAADLGTAQALTSQYQLVPLSAYAQFVATGVYAPQTDVPVHSPNPDFIAAPIPEAPGFSQPEFFDVLARTAVLDPPPASQLESGFLPALDGFLHQNQLTPDIVAAAGAAMDEYERAIPRHNGWSLNLNVGQYGTQYLARAATARFGLGASLPADAVYASAANDAAGAMLSGPNNYVVHFPAGQTPPVNGFWSLTVYGSNELLVANSINRYSVGSVSGLVPNADGSIDVLLQSAAPATGPQANWLPTPPAGQFTVTLRMYWPNQAVLDGGYIPPPIQRSLAQ